MADPTLIADAFSWLIGDADLVEIEETKSYHNSPMYLITATADKRSSARRALPRLGAELLTEIGDDITTRIDDNNNLHLRIKLDELVCGILELTNPNEPFESVKGRIKLEVYPNDEPLDVATRLLHDASKTAERKGFPEPPKRTIENE